MYSLWYQLENILNSDRTTNSTFVVACRYGNIFPAFFFNVSTRCQKLFFGRCSFVLIDDIMENDWKCSLVWEIYTCMCLLPNFFLSFSVYFKMFLNWIIFICSSFGESDIQIKLFYIFLSWWVSWVIDRNLR